MKSCLPVLGNKRNEKVCHYEHHMAHTKLAFNLNYFNQVGNQTKIFKNCRIPRWHLILIILTELVIKLKFSKIARIELISCPVMPVDKCHKDVERVKETLYGTGNNKKV